MTALTVPLPPYNADFIFILEPKTAREMLIRIEDASTDCGK